MKTITKINPLSAGKMYALLLGAGQIISGIIILLFGAQLAKYVPQIQTALANGYDMKQMALSTLSAVIGGFILAVVSAAIYNLVASGIGGIKVELE